MPRRLFILVEGNDDERFFEHAIKPLLNQEYDQITIWQHAQKSNESELKFLRSIKTIGADYIYVVDMDDAGCVNDKKKRVTKRLEEVDFDNILVVIKEIEAWYLAGVDQKRAARIGFEAPAKTDNIYKEDFVQLIPRGSGSKIDFMMELVKSFSLKTGIGKNESLNYFFRNFIEPLLGQARRQLAGNRE
ncbi:MAG TPA: hypothetical protein VKY40_01535 [Halanaerobiales bacterium]|nr:hypothetical protein [Halanaerobiales bacterium]